jgi:hypothetical protein
MLCGMMIGAGQMIIDFLRQHGHCPVFLSFTWEWLSTGPSTVFFFDSFSKLSPKKQRWERKKVLALGFPDMSVVSAYFIKKSPRLVPVN